MSLRFKLLGGFGIMVLFSVFIAGVNIYNNRITRRQAELQSDAFVPEIQAAEKLNSAVSVSGEHFTVFQYTFAEPSYQAAMASVAVMEESVDELSRIATRFAQELPLLKSEIGPLTKHVADYKKACQDVYTHAHTLPELYKGMTGAGEKVGELIFDYFRQYRSLAANETEKLDKAALARRFDRYDSGLDILTDVADARRKMFELQASRDPRQQERLYTEARRMMGGIQKSIEDMRSGTKLEVWIRRCDALLDNINKWNGFVDSINAETMGMNKFVEIRQAMYGDLLRTASELAHGGMTRIDASAHGTADDVRSNLRMSIILAALSVVAGFIISLLITRSITRPVAGIIAELTQAAAQVEASSSSFTDTSGALAENTASQAATLQETGAALEEMASATNQNADHARNTQNITDETISRIQAENASMQSMSAAMSDINEQADKISHIIKTIEEIAFQTNLLALNAAVEAARAGEAGKGFAVVADEVRSLAGRSASAAKDTSELINATVESVRHGAGVAVHLREGFGAINEGSESIGRLVRQIADATHDQAEGVSQINSAMSRLDKATQQISRMSVDSAESAQQLSEQTESLQGAMQRLVSLVGGRNAVPTAFASALRKGAAPRRNAVVSPSDLIPLDSNEA